MLSDASVATRPQDLAANWALLRQAKPGLRVRDAAAELGVSEAELVASQIGRGTVRLRPDWDALFAGLPKLNRVMALTRNEDAVHERRGIYSPGRIDQHVGMVLGADIDLRFFLKAWAFGFEVEESVRDGKRHSLQFFDRSGMALHKIYAETETDLSAWDALVDELRDPDQRSPLDIRPAAARPAPKDIGEIDAPALLDGWAKLQDTHEFVGLLAKAGAQPTQAFRIAAGRFTQRLDKAAVFRLLTGAASRQVPIMVFVGNKGMIQIHTGPVQRIERMGPWLNVLDADFNLHLREDRFAEIWHVEKPTADGIVTSVDVFDAGGERIATFFG
jgi:putative hemin transport protein